MSFNWAAFGLKLIQLAPTITAGVEQIHGAAKSGAEKKDLAIASLMLATGVADNVLPADQSAIADSVASEAGNLISSIVNIFNATGIFHHKTAAPTVSTPAPVVVPVDNQVLTTNLN